VVDAGRIDRTQDIGGGILSLGGAQDVLQV